MSSTARSLKLDDLAPQQRRAYSAAPMATEEPPDEALFRDYCAGDRAAFATLFGRYAGRVAAVMRRNGLNEQDADDLVQQTFLRAHQARHDFDPGRRFRPWLWTIAFNLLRDDFRKRATDARRRDRLAHAGRAAAQLDPPLDPASRDRVRTALAQLSDKAREVVLLHWYEGLSFAEIADVVNASESAVKVRAHRAYAQLRGILSEGETSS